MTAPTPQPRPTGDQPTTGAVAIDLEALGEPGPGNEALRERVAELENINIDAYDKFQLAAQRAIDWEAKAEAAQAREVELAGALDGFREHVLKYAKVWEAKGGSHHHSIWQTVAAALASIPADALKRARAIQKVADQLWIILPLAKGYAAKNNVGNNMQFIADAEEALSALGALTPEDAGT